MGEAWLGGREGGLAGETEESSQVKVEEVQALSGRSETNDLGGLNVPKSLNRLEEVVFSCGQKEAVLIVVAVEIADTSVDRNDGACHYLVISARLLFTPSTIGGAFGFVVSR